MIDFNQRDDGPLFDEKLWYKDQDGVSQNARLIGNSFDDVALYSLDGQRLIAEGELSIKKGWDGPRRTRCTLFSSPVFVYPIVIEEHLLG